MTDRVEAILQRGREARAVLENETVLHAMDLITERLQRDWRSTTANMTQRREELFFQIAAMDAVRGQLKAWVEQADYEAKQADKQNTRRLKLVR